MTENKNVISDRASLNDELSLKELILKLKGWTNYLFGKWFTILIVGTIGGAIGLGYAFFKDPVYIAETTFVLEEENNNGAVLGQLGGLAGLAGIDIGSGGGGLFQGDNIIQLYKSRSMIAKTLLSDVIINGKSQLLIDRYIEVNNLKESLNKDNGLKNFQLSVSPDKKFSRIQDSIINLITESINRNFLSVDKPDKKLGIIRVQVKSQDELFAKVFNDQLVKNVNDFYIQTKTKKSLENLMILQHQTDSVKEVLNNAINSSAMIVDATPNLNVSKQVLRAPAQRSQFNADANKAILTQLVQNLELAKLSVRKETPLIQLIDEPILPLLKDEVGKAKGIVVGGLIFGLAAIFYLLLKKIYLNIIREE